MKRIAALVVLAALGFGVAACGATVKKRGSVSLILLTTERLSPSPESLTVTGTTTIQDVKPGTSIGCKGGPRAKVPAGAGVVNAGSGTMTQGVSGASHSKRLQLTRSPNGTVTVICSQR